MAPKGEKKTKEQIAAAAAAGGRAKRKKWSKGKQKDKANHAVLFDKKTIDRFNSDVLKSKLLTPSIVVNQLKVNASAARAMLRDCASKGVIKAVGEQTHGQMIFTKA
ncbi:40S ribosomal protein S25 [Cryptosporidium ryanae]|uniref:40S ribosomal protein S25 n=1 Tax=Cryptosporidium ryanae TaxID=515981 RepID=UPI00351A0B5D|nr:40S ribosomal protein S25 [Cryptosporidium ryanae]